MSLKGTELVEVQGVTNTGAPSGETQITTTQAIANLGGGGGGGGVGRTVTASGAVTMTNADGIVNIAKTVGAATAVTGPPSPTAWIVYTVKDAKGDALTNPITITPASGTIDGSATYVIGQNYNSVDFYSDGTNLFTK